MPATELEATAIWAALLRVGSQERLESLGGWAVPQAAAGPQEAAKRREKMG